jgi:hypothetical protein
VTKHCIAIADEALHRLQWFASLPDALSVNVLSGQPFELADLILIQGADAQVANPFAAVDNSTRWAEAFEQKITALYEGPRAGTRGDCKVLFLPEGGPRLSKPISRAIPELNQVDVSPGSKVPIDVTL